MRFNGAPKCPRCSQAVYMAEQTIGPGGPWHKRCLRCKTCDKTLDSTTLTERENDVYCKVCYNRLYGPKGWGAANMSTETQISRFGNSSSEDINTFARASPSPELPMRSLRLSPEVPSLPPRNPTTNTTAKAPALPSRSNNTEASPDTPPLPPRNINESRSLSKNPFLQDSRDAKPVQNEVEPAKINETLDIKSAHKSTSQSSTRLFPPRSTSPVARSSNSHVPAFLSGHGVKRSNTTATFLSKSAIDPKPVSTSPATSVSSNNVPTKSFTMHRSTHSFSGIGSPNRKFNLGGGGDICPRCQKVVYAAESAMGAGVKYHKLCLRCSECSKSLDSSNMREREGTLYCKPCYAKLYGPKGYGYGEGAAFLTTEGAV